MGLDVEEGDSYQHACFVSEIQAVRHQLSFQVICTCHFGLQTSRDFIYIFVLMKVTGWKWPAW
jgi:hypothetical protein